MINKIGMQAILGSFLPVGQYFPVPTIADPLLLKLAERLFIQFSTVV